MVDVGNIHPQPPNFQVGEPGDFFSPQMVVDVGNIPPTSVLRTLVEFPCDFCGWTSSVPFVCFAVQGVTSAMSAVVVATAALKGLSRGGRGVWGGGGRGRGRGGVSF